MRPKIMFKIKFTSKEISKSSRESKNKSSIASKVDHNLHGFIRKASSPNIFKTEKKLENLKILRL
jgi:hypothetical protein